MNNGKYEDSWEYYDEIATKVDGLRILLEQEAYYAKLVAPSKYNQMREMADMARKALRAIYKWGKVEEDDLPGWCAEEQDED